MNMKWISVMEGKPIEDDSTFLVINKSMVL